MKRESRRLLLWLVASILAVVAGIGALELARSSGAPADVDHPSAFRLGPDSARVKVVEFSDYQCPACKAIEPDVKSMVSKHGDRIQFVYRNFPLPQHKNATKAALAAESAGAQGKFWRMHDRLFDTQDAWASLADPTEYFALLGREALVNVDVLREAIRKQAALGKVQADVAAGNRAGVQGTPTFFVNGKRVEIRQAKDFDAAVAAALASP